MKDSRLCAFDILYDVISNNAYSNIALDKELKTLSQQDRAFASRLVYGVIERRITLDYVISKYLTSRTKPKVKIILYIGAYQLYFTDNVSSATAIDESVKLCDKVGCSYYKKLVNAVLHKVDDNRIDIDSLDDLEVKYSCPKSLINMWTKHYSAETATYILESINGNPPVFAVPNRLFVNADELIYELMLDGIGAEKCGEIVRISSSFNLAESKAFKNGLFHIEDMSSYECAATLEANENDVVIDVCSAPGGKAFTIAEMMNGKGKLYAYDLYEHRVKLIKDGAERLALNNIICDVNNAEEFNESIPKADKILCDVPCSGFGVIRRKPEIRYKDLDSIKDLPEIQYKILETSSKYLKKGGRLIYSTCTLNKKENEKVVEKYLKNGGFTLIKQKTIISGDNGGDGFYFAVMEKTDD